LNQFKGILLLLNTKSRIPELLLFYAIFKFYIGEIYLLLTPHIFVETALILILNHHLEYRRTSLTPSNG